VRKIEKQVITRFINRESSKGGNTTTDGNKLLLFGNEIAMWNYEGLLFINHCGYETKTTQSRLNALLNLVNSPYQIRTVKGSFRLISEHGTEHPFEGGWLLVYKNHPWI